MNYRKVISGMLLLLGSFALLAVVFFPGALESSAFVGHAQAISPGAVATVASSPSAPAASPQRQPVTAAGAVSAPSPEAALAQLQAVAPAKLEATLSQQTGRYNLVRAPAGEVMVRDDASAKPLTRALAFLASYGGVIGMTDAERAAVAGGGAPALGSDLQVSRTQSDDLGFTHVRLDQAYKGLKVHGGQVIVHMNEHGITAVNGNFVPEVALSTVPALTKEVASAAAVAISGKGAPEEELTAAKVDLGVYPYGLLENQASLTKHLAYAVVVATPQERKEQVWIDANSGVVLSRVPLRHSALYREVWSPKYEPLPPPAPQPFLQRKEGDPPHPTPFVNNLYDFAGQSYNLYASAFGRDSYDGMGHKMISVYEISDFCPNARWNGEFTQYCPIFDADDVVSHEWGHAYTEYTHGLIYQGQSGALNESYSDIWGEVLDLHNGADGLGGTNNAQPSPDGQRWVVGEDLGEQAQSLLLRDMYNPELHGDPAKTSSSSYHCTSDDAGGVHTNSGVPNHAFALLVDGTQFKPADEEIGQAAGTYNGYTLTGIGFTKATNIYWRAQSVYQTPSTNFPAHEQALKISCSDLVGQPIKTFSTSSATGTVSNEVITQADCGALAQVMLAVEMSGLPPCPLTPLLNPAAPPICPGAATNVIFEEDWEGANADAGWTRTSNGYGSGTADWNDATRPLRDFKLTSTLPGGRTGQVIFADNIPVGEPGGGTCTPGGDYSGEYTIDSPAITIPAGKNNVHLSFDHFVATEGTVDGGQLEVSTDNGLTWQVVPRTLYVFNPYNGAYDAPPPVGVHTGPNPGEEAWTGTNGGTLVGSWGTSVVDLSSIATPGTTIKLRFHWTQDGCNGVDGWYIDNIRVFDCVTLPAPVLSAGGDYQNNDPDGSYTLTWTRPPGAHGPDVLEESQTSCAPLFFDNAEGSIATNWATTRETLGPTWQDGTKPGHAPNKTFWARPTGGEATFGEASMTMKNAVTIPFAGTTTLSFREWYFNETDDRGFVEITTDNGATWTTIYTNARPMGGLPSEGSNAFASEPLAPVQVDLTPYKGKSVKVRFRMFTGDFEYYLFVTYGWYVDDILIQNNSWTEVANTNSTSALVSGRGTGSYCYRARTNYTFGTETVPSPFSNILSTTVAEGVTPLLTGAASRKLHNNVPFEVPLPLAVAGLPGVECRSAPGGTHQVVFKFDQAATFTGAQVTGGGSVQSTSGSGTNEAVVNLQDVPNAQTIQITLQGVSDGSTTQNFSVPMSVLLGDTNGDRSVNSGDAQQTRNRSGQPAAVGNFRSDVNTDGTVNVGDAFIVRAQSGSGLPSEAPPPSN